MIFVFQKYNKVIKIDKKKWYEKLKEKITNIIF